MGNVSRETEILQKNYKGPGVVTHTCNPDYLGGRNQEDCSSRLAQPKSLQDFNSADKS
jgi:hypothetical protein